jgi:hypothetical protein
MFLLIITVEQILRYIIAGIKNGNYEAAINLAQECIDGLEAASKANKPSDANNEKSS